MQIFVFCLFQTITLIFSSLPVGIYWIEENLEKGSLIGQLSNTLSAEQSKVKYRTYTSLAQNRASQFFHVDSNEGNIYAAQQIDRELLCEDPRVEGHGTDRRMIRSRRSVMTKSGNTTVVEPSQTHHVTAFTDQLRPGRAADVFTNHLESTMCHVDFQVHIAFVFMDGTTESGLQDVQIMIADVNDNVPQFYSTEIVLQVLESSPIDAELRLPHAMDSDSGVYGVTDYRMLRPNVEGKNSCESVSHPETSLMNPADSGPAHPSVFSTRLDSPNYVPFAGDYFVLQTYKQSDGFIKPFIRQIRPLDRELTEKLYFCLIAEDGDGNRGLLSVTLELLDANDNIPQWQGLPYKVSIPECEYNHPSAYINNGGSNQLSSGGLRLIFTLQATDRDIGRNGHITYRYAGSNSLHVARKFESKLPTVIVRENQVLLVSKLDFETLRKFWIPVEAVDGGGLVNFTEIEVTVEDCNDHTPSVNVIALNTKRSLNFAANNSRSLLPEHVFVEVLEEDRQRIDLATVMAHDMDEQDSGLVTCRLETRNTRSEFDFTNYFSMEPVNSDQSSRISSIKLGTERSSNKPSMFTLYKREGVALDRELIPSIALSILCTDNSLLKTHETRKLLYVRVRDINDNAPRFTSSSQSEKVGPFVTQIIHAVENEPFGSLVGSVHATDADENMNARLNYAFLNPTDLVNVSESHTSLINGLELFQLDRATGKLFTRVSLDREQNTSFVFYVRVTDEGIPPLSSTVRLHVMVTDVNDSPPKFLTTPNMNGRIVFIVNESVGQNQVHGRLIGQLEAEDADDGANKSIHFEFIEDSLTPVGIPTNYRVTAQGRIYADGVMDREQCSQHQFTVRAIDGGPVGQRLSSTAIVNVQLMDINDSPPYFIEPSSKESNGIPSDVINISVNLPPGSVLYHIQARDDDEKKNTKLRFVLRAATFLSEYFALRPVASHTADNDEVAEANTELILTHTLSQPPSIRSSNGSQLYSHISAQPREYFVYIIAKDSEFEPSHSCTARLKIHVYHDVHTPGRLMQTEKMQNTNTSLKANLNQRTNTFHLPIISEYDEVDSEKDHTRQRQYKTASMTVILVMAIVIICIFLGVFCFVAFLYLRGTPHSRTEQISTSANYMNDNAAGKCEVIVDASLPAGTLQDDTISACEQAVYWELMNQRGE
ncbi:protocadherin delta 1 [Paragonimus westermani]|uniref:Protocadherin delta 1 n=1 Tax=Paragonimus westermani TaxID=34504 RepID=A0A5J4NV45_9TREM|nr:protocadherin delta 1 [Paragonimus westermani]